MTISKDIYEQTTFWRRQLHQIPEPSGREVKTAKFISRTLDELGIPHTRGVGGHGIVGTLRRGQSNRSVGLRADFDALPIHEMNSFAHASQHAGAMHACGHDGHTACLLGAAAVLMKNESWSGTIQLVFQPAEENGTGAKAMIADGLFERFPMERVFGFHNNPGMEAGLVGVFTGPSMSAGGDWFVTLKGVSGHAAQPHLTRDPVLAAGHLIVALHGVVSRNVDPLDTVVLTVSSVNGGTVSNQIPEIVKLVGTLRTFKPEVRAAVIKRMEQVIEGVAAAFGMDVDYEIKSTGRAMADTPEEAQMSVAAAQAAGLPVTRDIRPVMGGDDFAFLVKDRLGSYVFIGNGPLIEGKKLHQERYDFNDAVIPTAITWLTSVAKHALAAAPH